MDPNETLDGARIYADNVMRNPTSEEDVFGLVERFQALDEWLSKGGFLPSDWTPHHALTRAEVRDGTGFSKGTRFIPVRKREDV